MPKSEEIRTFFMGIFKFTKKLNLHNSEVSSGRKSIADYGK